MWHHHDCVHVLLIWAALTHLSWQQTIKSAWTQIPTFYLSSPEDPRSTQTFTRRINFCYESCREITWSEFALDLPTYTSPHKDINISHRAFYLWVQVKNRHQPEQINLLIISKTHILLCDCFGTATNQPLRGGTFVRHIKIYPATLGGSSFQNKRACLQRIKWKDTKKVKYAIRLLYFTELPEEVFPWSDKVKQTHAVNVSSLRLVPVIGWDADWIFSLIQ